MSLSKTWKSYIGLFLVFGLGVGLVGLHILHALEEGETIRTFLYGILIPLTFSLGIVASGVWLWRSDFDGGIRSVFRSGVGVGLGFLPWWSCS